MDGNDGSDDGTNMNVDLWTMFHLLKWYKIQDISRHPNSLLDRRFMYL